MSNAGILLMANALTIFSQRHGDSSNEIKTKPVGRVNVTGASQPVDEKKPRGSREKRNRTVANRLLA